MLFRFVIRIYHILLNSKKEPVTNPIKVIHPAEPVKIKKEVTQDEATNRQTDLRTNKSFINKLLTLNFSDMSFDEKLLFNNDESYFLKKKQLMIENGNLEQQMRSLHSKFKAIDPDAKFNKDRKDIMQELSILEDKKSANWTIIDTWEDLLPPAENKPEDAEKKAIEKLKLIKAHENFIYRAEITLPGMPEGTTKEKKKKQEKRDEMERRLNELIILGSPYNRKSRKK